MKERKKQRDKKADAELILVFCRFCMRWFADSLDWDKAEDSRYDIAFVCPFCKCELWLK